MRGRILPQILFCASAVLFGGCAVLQFLVGQIVMGAVFALIAAAAIAAFVLIRLGRITW